MGVYDEFYRANAAFINAKQAQMAANQPVIEGEQRTDIRTVEPAMVERMVALVRDIATLNGQLHQYQDRATDILKALEPVDEDEAIAQQLNNDSAYDLTGLGEEHAARNVRYIQATILEAIKRGRELERECGEAGR